MGSPPKPWKAEYAKSGRSSCKTCKNSIEKEVLRLGKMVQATQFDGFMPMWNHASCVLKKAKQIKSIDDVEGLESLRWEDQQKIRSYVEGGGPATSTNVVVPMEYGIEVSQTSRATCKHCSQKILKGEVRMSSKSSGQGSKGLAWHHAKCFMDLYPSVQPEKLPGWEGLQGSDQASVSALVKNIPRSTKSGTTVNEEEGKKLQPSTLEAGKKRRKDVVNDQKSKVAKSEGDVSMSRSASANSVNDMEHKLESQSKELWDLKDDLKRHVTTAELREMLEANGQDSTGSELDLRDRW